jgi:hypothetical protein
MAKYVYVFGVKADSDNVAQIEAAAGTRGTPPKKRYADKEQRSLPPAANAVMSKYSNRPEEPKILFFMSPVYETNDPTHIDLGPLRPLLELSDDWVVLRVDG